MAFCACGKVLGPVPGVGCACGRPVDLPVPGAPGCAPRARGGALLTDRMAMKAAALRHGADERFGLQAYDLSLVWSRWSGSERGEGDERQLLAIRIFPRPRIEDLSAIAYAGTSGGVMPVGSVRVSKVSPILTADVLSGLTMPDLRYMGMLDECGYPVRFAGREDKSASLAGLSAREALLLAAGRLQIPTHRLEDRVSFFYELQERNGVGDRMKFRLASIPFKRRDAMDWTFTLERISEDRTRDGRSRAGLDPAD